MILLNIGYGNYVSIDKIAAIINPNSSPAKRLVHIGKNENNIIDATCGRRTRSMIILDDKKIVLSSIQPETLAVRLDNKKIGLKIEGEEEEDE